MVTDEDRAAAAVQAKAIVAAGYTTKTHYAMNLSPEESFRRGLLCECAMANRFGLKIVWTIANPLFGDGGRDFLEWMRGTNGLVHVPIDVKCTSVRANIDATHLCVNVTDLNPDILYVYGVYWTLKDDAEVLRWEWGRTLLNRNDVRLFKNNRGIPQYVIPYPELRDIAELDERIVEKRCHCGEWGHFGERDGKWYCHAHRPPRLRVV